MKHLKGVSLLPEMRFFLMIPKIASYSSLAADYTVCSLCSGCIPVTLKASSFIGDNACVYSGT